MQTQIPANIESIISGMTATSVLFEINKTLMEKDFSEFFKQAWDIVEPGRPLQWNWHLKAKCDHLQAVYNFTVPEDIDPEAKNEIGIQRIIFNEPPRCSKSLSVSVMFNAWVWTKWPGARFLCTTYADDLAQRDSLNTRQLVESEWYQSRWPIVKISDDQRSKSRFNIIGGGGFRVSTTILGMATGEGGDFRIVDDPHNVKKALSDVERQQANTFFDLTLPTRVVDPKRSSTIICMQRLHEDDMTGHALASENRYEHLCLPMEYEGENRCRTSIGFVDPRTSPGDLLHPERWDRKAVEEAKADLRIQWGDFGVNSQFQQRPTPRGGGLFQVENLIPVPGWPHLHELDRVVRYWDKAATQGGTGAETAGVLMARNKITNRTIILDVVHGRWESNAREQQIQLTSHQDLRRLGLPQGVSGRYAVRVEQEPGSGGKDSALWTVRNLSGFNVKAIPKRTNKEADWQPLSSQVNSGGVECVVGTWNQAMRSQMASAPFGVLKDILDAAAGGFKYIWMGPRAGVLA